jgi:hypothetical protein
VKEEQDEIFPKARKAAELDLKQMGEEITARKAQLMEEYGIGTQEPAPAGSRQSTTHRHA